jgi:glycine dehydrogenase
MASMYAVFHGPKGLRAIAERVHFLTQRLARALKAAGAKVAPRLLRHDHGRGWRRPGRYPGRRPQRGAELPQDRADRVGISLDETTDERVLIKVLRAFGIDGVPPHRATLGFPEEMLRTTDYLTHPVFHMNRAESEMMRYMRRLSDRDLALDRAMIPLGSCTMKLNAAAEMMPITWPEFGSLHPFAPRDQAAGYHEAIDDLSAKLCEITGYDAFSMQPNSGAQGEYAGLLTILAYHRARGDKQRTVCLIPTSAHGTNPASAQMAGMEVVVVKSAPNGDVDVEDFRAKAVAAATRLAACMITYPSTHGVFEETVKTICKITHDHGGQVYIDGANMNALVGLVKPGEIGGDVSHLNLHKTFAIPHGGGGPGMGPIGVKAHLAPHLPGHPETVGLRPRTGHGFGGALRVGLDPADQLGLLPDDGRAGPDAGDAGGDPERELHRGTAVGHYPILFMGNKGRVAHECILDTRPFAEAWRDGGRHRQAPDRQRIPRADDELAGGGHADGGADGVRDQGRDRPLHHRPSGDPRGDPGGGKGRDRRGFAAAPRPAHGGGAGRRLGPEVQPRGRAASRRGRSGWTSTGRRWAGSTTSTATAT